jgi:hypothetical protein
LEQRGREIGLHKGFTAGKCNSAARFLKKYPVFNQFVKKLIDADCLSQELHSVCRAGFGTIATVCAQLTVNKDSLLRFIQAMLGACFYAGAAA